MKVVLLRGLGREAGHWPQFISKIKERIWCESAIGLDLPGNGKFHKISSPLSINESAEFLHLQFQELDDQEGVIIIGLSMGAMAALDWANKYPNEVKGLVLINTSVKEHASVWQRLKWQSLVHFYKILSSKDPYDRELEVLAMVSNDHSKHKVTAEKWAEVNVKRPISTLNLGRQLLAAANFSAENKRPRCPTLILASEQDQMVNSICSKKLAANWQSEIHMNRDGGHELTLDDPDWVIDKVDAWVQASY